MHYILDGIGGFGGVEDDRDIIDVRLFAEVDKETIGNNHKKLKRENEQFRMKKDTNVMRVRLLRK